MQLRDERLYLIDIREAIGRIRNYTAGGKREFMASQLIQDAVAKNLENIGLAASRLSEKTRTQAPEVPWSKVVALRHRVAHEYFNISLDIVWETVDRDLAALQTAIDRLLGD